jgi:ribosomal protein L40E
MVTLLVFLTQTASAATVSLKVETIEGSGSSIETPISTGSCQGLGALQFDLTYDPTIVEPEWVETGSALPNGLVESKVKAPGLLGIALISSVPVSKSGELLKVRFKPLATEGSSTDLEITGETAWDYENNLEMLVTTEAGSLSLTPGTPKAELPPNSSLRIPLMIGGIGSLVLILITALVMRGRGSQSSAAAASACDTSRQSVKSLCEKCGAQHNPEARFCPKCGHAIDPSTPKLSLS